ncbi:MAG: hypothetical protein Q9174_001732 [Haloplaca sp. 1 TL-2023]
MRPPSLSRFACTKLLTYLLSFSDFHNSVQAANADTVNHEDHNHHRLLGPLNQQGTLEVEDGDYESAFLGVDRGIIGRAPAAITALGNNAPQPMNIEQGDIQFWTFPARRPQASRRQAASNLPLNTSATNTTSLERDLIQLANVQRETAGSPVIYLAISTCDQPTSGQNDGPAQLEVYVSLRERNQEPDSGRNDRVMSVEEGYGSLNVTGVDGDLWIGVRAPRTEGFRGIYNYELAASVDAPYATYLPGDPTSWDTEITPWDTDINASILATGPITNEFANSSVFESWMEMQEPPFKIYVHDQADPAISGLKRSVCGLKKHAKMKESKNSMSKIGGQPRQLFYVEGLNQNSTYDAIMTLEPPSGNSSIGGGGAVWRATNFTTKSEPNCQIIYDLPFCNSVAYAVPSNPEYKTDMTKLKLTYDDYAREAYGNFNKSLQQIPCNTTPSAQYSLARNCNDCDNSYKAWLCAVTIPRCVDFSAKGPHIIPRNLNADTFANGTTVPSEPAGSVFSPENKTSPHYGFSRNQKIIDEKIKPGPYKEMLPCKELCYHLMQDCPAALQFRCPTEGRGLNYSYGDWDREDRKWLCNWPGGTLGSGGGRREISWVMLGCALTGMILYVL